MLSLTECVWDFQKNALWDTHLHLHRATTASDLQSENLDYYIVPPHTQKF